MTGVEQTVVRSDLRVGFRSMASDIGFWLVDPSPDAQVAVDGAREIVERVAASCTRFDADSALMRANAAGRRWEVVPQEAYDAISEAHSAHLLTDGLFDPRVLRVLTAYGYDMSLPFETRSLTLPEASVDPPRRGGLRGRRWRPGLDPRRRAVRVGREPIDLGGIGKGLAVRWAGERLAGAARAALVEAGGDVLALGGGPDGDGWLVAVEDPFGGAEPAAVLRLTDLAAATSSIRVRSWTVGDTPVHHLIDPRTGRSSTADLRAVTVVGPDPALAEVWSKVLFLSGRGGVRAAADSRGLAALWVEESGRVGVSRAMRPSVAWQVSRVA